MTTRDPHEPTAGRDPLDQLRVVAQHGSRHADPADPAQIRRAGTRRRHRRHLAIASIATAAVLLAGGTGLALTHLGARTGTAIPEEAGKPTMATPSGDPTSSPSGSATPSPSRTSSATPTGSATSPASSSPSGTGSSRPGGSTSQAPITTQTLGETVSFEYFTVTVTEIDRKAGIGEAARVQVCVPKAPPGIDADAVPLSWNPWRATSSRTTGGIAAGEGHEMMNDWNPGYLASSSTVKEGDCAEGWLPFSIADDDHLTTISYVNADYGYRAAWTIPTGSARLGTADLPTAADFSTDSDTYRTPEISSGDGQDAPILCQRDSFSSLGARDIRIATAQPTGKDLLPKTAVLLTFDSTAAATTAMSTLQTWGDGCYARLKEMAGVTTIGTSNTRHQVAAGDTGSAWQLVYRDGNEPRTDEATFTSVGVSRTGSRVALVQTSIRGNEDNAPIDAKTHESTGLPWNPVVPLLQKVTQRLAE